MQFKKWKASQQRLPNLQLSRVKETSWNSREYVAAVDGTCSSAHVMWSGIWRQRAGACTSVNWDERPPSAGMLPTADARRSTVDGRACHPTENTALRRPTNLQHLTCLHRPKVHHMVPLRAETQIFTITYIQATLGTTQNELPNKKYTLPLN